MPGDLDLNFSKSFMEDSVCLHSLLKFETCFGNDIKSFDQDRIENPHEIDVEKNSCDHSLKPSSNIQKKGQI